MASAPHHDFNPDLTIGELGRQIRAGALSPVALTEQLLERIASLDGALGAWRLVLKDRALAEARAAEAALKAGSDLGPLHGIPYGTKDLIDVKGYPTTAGWPGREGHRAAEDATVTRRLAQAGMVLLGKTNMVQFAYGGVGINHHHGTPRNPWDGKTHRVPGGSSSGTAVAVGASMVPMGIGSDTGGSVRIPAALCGTVGLKTTLGRISRFGVFPLSPSLDTIGPLARSVEDAALVYQALHGPDTRDPSTWAHPSHDALATLHAGVKGLRLGIPEAVFWEDLDPDVGKSVRAAADVLRDLGAHVTAIPFPEAEEARQLNPRGLIIAAEAYALQSEMIEKNLDTIDPIVGFRMLKGKEIPAWEYARTVFAWGALREKAQASLRDVDALITPATAITSRPLAEVDRDIETYSRHNLLYLRNTAVGNILNLCAVTLPCGFDRQGLPIGLTLYGKPCDESMVLRVAHAYEQATKWHERRPNLDWAKKGQ
jgi:aspartyl-tRNA(Asn)/glutamyl-tRNA(Gln) amidotransferase subunit A